MKIGDWEVGNPAGGKSLSKGEEARGIFSLQGGPALLLLGLMAARSGPALVPTEEARKGLDICLFWTAGLKSSGLIWKKARAAGTAGTMSLGSRVSLGKSCGHGVPGDRQTHS